MWSGRGFLATNEHCGEEPAGVAPGGTRPVDFGRFFDAPLDLLCVADVAGRFVRVSRSWSQLLGHAVGDLEGRPFLDFVHPDDLPATRVALEQLQHGQDVLQFVNRYLSRDGTYRWIEWRAKPEGGLVFASARDVTKRVVAEESLRASRTKLEDLMAVVGDWLWETDADRRFVSCSEGVRNLLGYAPEEVLGRKAFDFMVAEDAERLRVAALEDHAQGLGCSDLVNRNLHRDGHEVVVRTSCVPVFDSEGRVTGFRGVDKDITAASGAERALRESEERFRLIAENVADVIWVLDLATQRFTYVSPSVERLLGYVPAEVLERTLEESLTPESFRQLSAALDAGVQGLIEGRSPLLEGMWIDQPCRDGSVVNTEVSVKLLPGPYGRPSQVLGVSRDVTRRRTVEDALIMSQERLQDLVFLVGDWIWETDADFRYTFCSDGVQKVLGHAPEEVVGRLPWDFMTPDDAPKLREAALERKAKGEGCSGLVNRNLHRSGREVVLLTSSVPIFDGGGELTGFRGVDKDITESTRTEESLRRSVIELNTLWRISETVAGPADLFAAVSSVMQQISDLFQAKSAMAVIFGEGVEGRHVITANLADGAHYEEQFMKASVAHLTLFADIALGGVPVVVDDLNSGPIPSVMRRQASRLGFSRVLVVPLVLHAQTIGTLVITRDSAAPSFQEREIDFAKAAAGSIAASIVDARLREEEKRSTALQVRDHLARELHDAVTQSVYSASLIAEALPTILERAPDQALTGLGQLHRLVRSALAELRILLYELRPATLAGVDLSQLLGRLADSLSGQSDVEVDLELEAGIEAALPPDVRVAMYRIAQEAFNNIAKHARAGHVWVRAVQTGGAIVLSLQDDGVGLPARLKHDADHMGLDIMRERAREIGAALDIERTAPTGTRVTVRWTPPADTGPAGPEQGGSG